MKKNLFVVLVLSILTIFMAVSVQGALVRHYEFEETSGTILADSSGSGQDATLSGITLAQTGVIGDYSVLFPSSLPQYNGFVFNNTGLTFNADSDLTLSFWMKYDSAPSGSARYTIFPVPQSNNNRFSMYFDDCWACSPIDDAYRMVIAEYYGSSNWQDIQAFHENPTEWNMATFVYNGTGDKSLKWYINGVLSHTEEGITAGWSGGNPVDPNGVGGFSRYNTAPAQVSFYMDDYRLYDNAMSEEEVRSLFYDTHKLLRSYSFEETAGNTISDSRHGVTGYITNNVDLNVAGRDGSGVYLGNLAQGTEGINFTTGTDINFSDATDFTIEFWTKFDAQPTSFMGLSMSPTADWFSNPQNSFQLRFDYCRGCVDEGYMFTVQKTGDGFAQLHYEPSTFGDWHHLALTYSASGDQQVRMYVDGIQRQNETIGFSGATPLSPTDFFGLFRYANQNYPIYIDEFNVYGSALSEETIQQIMNFVPPPPYVVENIYESVIYNDTIKVEILGSGELSSVDWYLDGVFVANENLNTPHTFTGLAYGTEYNITAVAKNYGGDSQPFSKLFTTAPYECYVPLSGRSYVGGDKEWLFCGGTYNASNIFIANHNVNVTFDGTHIINDGNGIILTTSYLVTNVKVICKNGAIIDGNGLAQTGIYQGEWTGNNDAVDVIGCTFQGFSSGTPIFFQNAKGNKVINNTFLDGSAWINTKYVEVINNTFYNPQSWGYSSGFTNFGNVTGNTFYGDFSYGFAQSLAGEEAYIQNNYFGGDVNLATPNADAHLTFTSNTIDGGTLLDSDDGDTIIYCVGGTEGNDFINGASYSGLDPNDGTCPLPLAPIDITDISAGINPTSIGVTAVAGQQIDTTDWYVDGVLYESGVLGVSTTISGLDPETEYNITVVGSNAYPSSDTYSELITTTAIVCQNLTSDTFYNSPNPLYVCSGTHYVQNVQFDGIDVIFEDANTQINSMNAQWGDTGVILSNGASLYCNGGEMRGGDDWGEYGGSGVQGINVWGDNTHIEDCGLYFYDWEVTMWYDNNNIVLRNLDCGSGVHCDLHGHGSNSLVDNVRFTYVYALGMNTTIQNSNFVDFYFGHDGCGGGCPEAQWSGSFINNVVTGNAQPQQVKTDDYINISGNQFKTNQFAMFGGQDGNDYVYGNVFFDDWYDDSQSPNYLTMCVDGIGNAYVGNAQYNGQDVNGGTCPSGTPPYLLYFDATGSPLRLTGQAYFSGDQPDTIDWYVDGNYISSGETMTMLSGILENTDYNISMVAQTSGYDDITASEIVNSGSATCINLQPYDYITQDSIICTGTHVVTNVDIGSGVMVKFEDANTNVIYDDQILGTPDFQQNWYYMFRFGEGDSILDCNGGLVDGYFDDQEWQGHSMFAVQSNNNLIQNCRAGKSWAIIDSWWDRYNNKYYNLHGEYDYPDTQDNFIHGGGSNAEFINVTNMGGLLMGYDQYIDGFDVGETNGWYVTFGHPNFDCCSDSQWSGVVVNSVFQDAGMSDWWVYNDPFDFHNNIFYGWMYFPAGGNNGQQLFYDNVVGQWYGGMDDYTDYQGGDYITWCSGGVGGIGNTYPNDGYFGGDPDFGTCPAQDCAVDFVDGCKFTQNTNIPTDTYYNIAQTYTQADNIVIDCQNSEIHGYWTADGEPESYFLNLMNNNVTLKNCVFRDYFAIVSSQNKPNDFTVENVNWEEFKEASREWGSEKPSFNYQWRPIGWSWTIKNSYFGGTTYFATTSDQPYWTWGGDYCENSQGEYVPNSDLCNDWDYETNGATEEECAPNMWNSDLQRCEDSRFRYAGGNCLPFSADCNGQYFNGYWYSCDYENYNSVGFTATNNIFNKTADESNDEDQRWFTLYNVNDILLENNTWYAQTNPDYDQQLLRISASDGVVIRGNKVYGGSGFNIMPHEWDSPNCQNNDVLVEDNEFHITRPLNNGYSNYFTSMNNSVIRNNLCDFEHNPDAGICMIINNGGDVPLYNLEVYGNEFQNYAEPLDCGNVDPTLPCRDRSVMFVDWGASYIDGFDVHDNQFEGTVYMKDASSRNAHFYDNSMDALHWIGSYLPERGTGMDLCNGGIGNSYDVILTAGGVTENWEFMDLYLDPACDTLDVKDGMYIGGFWNPQNEPYTLEATGVTLTGDAQYGLRFMGNYRNTGGLYDLLIVNATVNGLNIDGFNRSIYFDDKTYDNVFVNGSISKWYVDEGTNNQVLFSEYTCNEDYAPVYSECVNGSRTVDYVDLNDCGSSFDKPESTVESCTLQIDCGDEYVGTDDSSYTTGNDCFTLELKKAYDPDQEIFQVGNTTKNFKVGTNKEWKLVIQGIEEREVGTNNKVFHNFKDFDLTSTVIDGYIRYENDYVTLNYKVDGVTAKTDLYISEDFPYAYPNSELWVKTFEDVWDNDNVRYTHPDVNGVSRQINVQTANEGGKKFTYQQAYRGLTIYIDPIYEPCIEWWRPQYGACGIDDQQLLTYYDQNQCGSDLDLPAENGTMVSCNYCTADYTLTKVGECVDYKTNATYSLANYNSCCALTNISADCEIPPDTLVNCAGVHDTNDISGVAVDTLVEIGVEGVKIAPLVALGTLATYLLFLI